MGKTLCSIRVKNMQIPGHFSTVLGYDLALIWYILVPCSLIFKSMWIMLKIVEKWAWNNLLKLAHKRASPQASRGRQLRLYSQTCRLSVGASAVGTWSTCASTRGTVLCCSPLRQPWQFPATQLGMLQGVGELEIFLRFLDMTNPNLPSVFSNLNVLI